MDTTVEASWRSQVGGIEVEPESSCLSLMPQRCLPVTLNPNPDIRDPSHLPPPPVRTNLQHEILQAACSDQGSTGGGGWSSIPFRASCCLSLILVTST